MKYLQSKASKFVHGDKPTNNPTMAARFILARFGGGRSLREYGRRVVKKKKQPGNPLLAGVGAIGGITKVLGGLGKRFGKPSEVRAAAIAPAIVQAANAGNLTAARGLMERAQRPMIAKEAAVWKAAILQVAPNIIDAVTKNLGMIPQADQKNPEAFAASIAASPVQLPGAGHVGGAPPAAGLAGTAALITPGLVTGVVRALKPAARRSTRGRYPTYVDRQGRQRYSTKPPGTELRLPAGASVTPGTPYNFFTGAVGKGGAAATAGQVALAGAAGVGAYLVTQRLLQHLGGAAQRKEEAGVAAALAFRQARADFKKQQGRDPNRAELQEMKRAYQEQLVELGYDPVTFTRSRSRVEAFLEDYNPLD